MRPQEHEYPAYYSTYIKRVPEQEALIALQNTIDELLYTLPLLPANMADHRYAEGKWTVKEVLQHIIDTERVMAYRALTIARGDTTPLPGFDENSYARTAQVGHRTLQDLAEEMLAVRKTSQLLVANFNEETLNRTGVANNNPVSVRGIAYIIAGHQRHHLAILQERYFPNIELIKVQGA